MENNITDQPPFFPALKLLRVGDVVAFKERERNMWFTGVVNCVLPPNKDRDGYHLIIYLNLPIEPQWFGGGQTVYFLGDITDLVVIEVADKQQNFLLPEGQNSGKNICADCGDRGWLYDDEGMRAGTCPCHY